MASDSLHYGIVTEPQPSASQAPSRSTRRVAAALAVVLAALLIVFVTNAGGLRSLVTGDQSGRIRSVVMLPLENLSRDPPQEYFADGLTDGLIAALAQISLSIGTYSSP